MIKRIPKYLREQLSLASYKTSDLLKKAVSTKKTVVEGFQITFLGAVGTVTGSKYLLENRDKKILIDCGLFQGLKELRLRNREPFAIPPKHLDAIILTHAHLDHSGFIPLLVKKGFKGKIYCTKATYDLCQILLPDSGYLQEEETRYARRKGYSKHRMPQALYTQKDAEKSLKHFKTVEFGVETEILDKFKVTFYGAGHILGASSVQIKSDDKSIMFSGDLGRYDAPIMNDPVKIPHSDYLVVESTYGDREHKHDTHVDKEIASVINETAGKGGTLVIPAFAVGRSQDILYHVYKLKKDGKIPDVPVFLDSPMSIKVTNLLYKYAHKIRLTAKECLEMYKGATFTVTTQQSKSINEYTFPKIIISASGMATGGRILHHIRNFGTDYKNTILFVGYQAEGTRGRQILEGRRDIKIHGQFYSIKADIKQITNTSAHADYKEVLKWLGALDKTPTKIFVTHGEPDAANAMKEKIVKKFKWDAVTPEYKETVIL